ncbi:MAG: YIP1 family protein [Dehalococcoidia bacterium]
MAEANLLVNRMIRAARLDVELYEEVEADTTANIQALQAVIVASVASALGSGFLAIREEGLVWFAAWLPLSLISSIIGWLIWSGLTYLIGTTILRGPHTSATYGELLRTIGFANSPWVLGFFIFIPFLGGLIYFIVWVWAIIAGVIAVRQALDFSTWRAIFTTVAAIIPYIAIMSVVQWVVWTLF